MPEGAADEHINWLSPRKQAVAKEVLRRCYEAAEGGRLWTYAWLPHIAVLGIARLALRRFRDRRLELSGGD